MADFSSIPHFNIKIVFIIHFILTSLSTLGYWSSSSYMFYNLILVITLLWSMHNPENGEPIRMAIFVNGTSIILDIILLAFCYPNSDAGARDRFSAAMAIIQVIVRPFTTLFLAKLLQDGVGTSEGIGNIFAGPRSRNYEDMDKSLPNPSQPTQGGYDFAQAQQI